MDINYLFLRQQVERSMAESAQDEAARKAHEQLAEIYEIEIERKTGGRIVFPWRRGRPTAEVEAEQLIIVPPTR